MTESNSEFLFVGGEDTNFSAPDEELPSYSMEGRILVHIITILDSASVYRYESEVLHYDNDSSVFWINEGVGFEYWLDSCDFTAEGFYVIEGIVGHYYRGDGWTTDDDEDWEYTKIRPATQWEIDNQTLESPPTFVLEGK